MKSVKICAIACIIAVAAVAGTAFANYGNATNENFIARSYTITQPMANDYRSCIE